MKVLLLAAGLGSRLRPFTNTVPKALVPLFDKPLLEHQLAVLHRAGLTDIAIASGYKGELLKPYGTTFHNPLYASSNMVTSLFCAEAFFNTNEDLLVAYTDIIYSDEVLNRMMASSAPVSIAADSQWLPYWQQRMADPLADVESFKLDPDTGQLEELGQKVQSLKEIQGQYMGLIKFSKNVIPSVCKLYHSLDKKRMYDGKDVDNMYMTSFLQLLIDRGFKTMPVFNRRGWIEVDTTEDLALYHNAGSLTAALQLGK